MINLLENENMLALKADLFDGIREYMQDSEDISYTEKDILKCENIVNEYLEKLPSTKSKKEGLKLVQKTVVALNKLNEKCDYELLETDQRELVCTIIINAGNLMGYNEEDEDITEEWREF